MGLLKKLNEANQRQREQVKEHGHGGMFEAAGAGAFSIGGFSPGTDASVVKIPWGLGQRRRADVLIQKRERKGWRLVAEDRDGGNNIVLTFEKESAP